MEKESKGIAAVCGQEVACLSTKAYQEGSTSASDHCDIVELKILQRGLQVTSPMINNNRNL